MHCSGIADFIRFDIEKRLILFLQSGDRFDVWRRVAHKSTTFSDQDIDR